MPRLILKPVSVLLLFIMTAAAAAPVLAAGNPQDSTARVQAEKKEKKKAKRKAHKKTAASDSTAKPGKKPLLSPEGFAGFDKTKLSPKAKKMADSVKHAAKAKSKTDVVLPPVPGEVKGDSPEISPENAKAYAEYQRYSLEHRKAVFDWQLTSSRWIFYVSVSVVVLGMILSFWQFYQPIHQFNKMVKVQKELMKDHKELMQNYQELAKDNTAQPAPAPSTIKFGKDGIEITSSVIGLLIMFISIAFFFMYLHYVYPIQVVGQ